MPNKLKKIWKFRLKADTFLNNAKQHFFCYLIKKGKKNMPNYDAHAKQHFLMPNHFWKNQISGIWLL